MQIFYLSVYRSKILRPFLFYLLEVQSTVFVSSPSQRERDCIDLVVIFNKRREETFAVSLQNRKSYVCIKYSTLVRPRKLIAMNFTFFTRCKMHITPVSLKYYFKKKVFHTKNVYVMFMFTPYAIKRYI